MEKFLKSRTIKVLARAEVLMVNIEVFLHIKPVFSGVWMTKEDGALHGLNFLVASKQILPKTSYDDHTVFPGKQTCSAYKLSS